MFLKEFEIRWSDVDANGHLANSAYTNFMSHTRMGYFLEAGFTFKVMQQFQISPVMFNESIYYFKESFISEKITVSLQMSGLSNDGKFFKFLHNFYNSKGKHLATCDVIGGFIDLKERRLTSLPQELLAKMHTFPKTDNFKELTKEDTRNPSKKPVDLK